MALQPTCLLPDAKHGRVIRFMTSYNELRGKVAGDGRCTAIESVSEKSVYFFRATFTTTG